MAPAPRFQPPPLPRDPRLSSNPRNNARRLYFRPPLIRQGGHNLLTVGAPGGYGVGAYGYAYGVRVASPKVRKCGRDIWYQEGLRTSVYTWYIISGSGVLVMYLSLNMMTRGSTISIW